MEERILLLRKATKFLQDDDIRTASTQRKRTFLLSKGLSDVEIESLLSTDASLKPTTIVTAPQNGVVTESGTLIDGSEESQQASGSSSARDAPPIITYPEFLLHTQKPPPLITAERLLTAGYAISGAAAVLYGTSKYLVEPMLDSLSNARHSLFESAHSNMHTLNAKLEENVSIVPNQGHGSQDEDMMDDGAPFFSRTVATQTSPRLSQSSSQSSISSVASPSTPVNHASQLVDMQSKLQGLKVSDNSDKSLKKALDEFCTYLNALPDTDNPNSIRRKSHPPTNDSISKMKTEIRGAKGVLLSARNFPAMTAR
ncbi:MAG: hypothetical protein OHK93_004567 [Ramalina farinacea]|uniref:Peroxisomal membrane protein PEX14 n=1 Tax=Ramalina farinacea TaxID=258253 RepID=A0AA43QWB1_9LECA|nr:hypothetical protein [Ramalina farinacea]